ncbi:GNAT family N-acetyltransferase [Rufibacter sp. XAAS-G3-1]|uniref:GNAT family N-acetyltransferase n=1 Tax=Rufibacter sp. XAAS-G3-1 TaxID=2729134 RepID=UPI0015E6DE19|nr:GNAT family N-acetyltransferase [Rufibacter sp. XAAS-G3-1]
MKVLRYTADYEKEWNDLVESAKNGHFMFQRHYMEYHSHRYQDASLLFFRKQKLVAVLPAHLDGGVFATHKGLTFGGVICDAAMTFSMMREVFASLLEYLKEQKVYTIFYKAIPYCYHRIPASEDIAVLTLLGAHLAARDLISVIDLKAPPVKYYRGVRWSIQKARKIGLRVQKSEEWEGFMDIMQNILQRKYGRQPAHASSELVQLAKRFPENIQLYGVYDGGKLLGGSVLFISEQVVHAQYLGMNEEGRRLRALPFFLDTIFTQFKSTKRYFSFGSSQDGEYVNESLYYFKESMGARAMLQEQYLLSFN